MYFCRSWFSNMVSFRYVLVFLNFLHDICSIKFYTISFLCKHNCFIGDKHTQWMLDTKVKVFQESISCFMKWPRNCISWNPLKEKFHSVSLPLKNSKTFLFLFFCDSTVQSRLSRTAATSKMECFVIAVNYYHKALHPGCCRSLRSASDEKWIL